MRTRGTGLLRIAVAAVFGFMSLLHGPVMTFAIAAAPPAHHAMAHAGHHHDTAPQDDAQPADAGVVPVCNAFGCLIALESLPARVPAASFVPLGAVTPGIASTMRATDIEPATPPPRLRV